MAPALLELRRYVLHPGAVRTLARVFIDELTVTQQQAGLQVIGPYTDPAEPDHFVWMRGFSSEDADARGQALASFYGGPAWAEHKDVANATMISFDDVHLLRPINDGQLPDGDLTLTLWALQRPLDPGQLQAVAKTRDGLLLATADVPNRFPVLPVRDDQVLVLVQPRTVDAAQTPAAAAGIAGIARRVHLTTISSLI